MTRDLYAEKRFLDAADNNHYLFLEHDPTMKLLRYKIQKRRSVEGGL
jgi:hypothetical protein